MEKNITTMKLEYAKKVLFNELTKIILLGVIFFVANLFVEFIVATAVLMANRTFSGGLHMNTKTGCFLFSLMIYTLCVVILPISKAPLIALVIVLALSYIAIIVAAPVQSKKKPYKSIERQNTLKKRAIICSTISMILLLLLAWLRFDSLFTVGVWATFLQSIQLLVALYIERRKPNVIKD